MSQQILKKIHNYIANDLLKLIFIFLVLRFLTSLVYCFLPINTPHLWRQIDTLSVTLRYWLRWAIELEPGPILMPAALNSGESIGIMPMEFPILNIITAPFFYFGSYYGKVLAHLFFVCIHFLLTYFNAQIWRDKFILGYNAYIPMLLLPLVSFGAIFVSFVMPDYSSYLFALIAIGLSWEKPKLFLTSMLLTLALLLKPTSVIVLSLLILHPQWFIVWRVYLLPCLLAICVTLFYYTFVKNFIINYQDANPRFDTNIYSIFDALKNTFAQPFRILDLFDTHAFFPLGFIPLLILSLFISVKDKEYKIITVWLLVLLQFIFIVAVKGEKTLHHSYYLIGMSHYFSLLFFICLKKQRFKPLLILFIMLWCGRFFEFSYMNIKGIMGIKQEIRTTIYSECLALKKEHPEVPWQKGEVFYSSGPHSFPALGLCFGEREGMLARGFGFGFVEDNLPSKCLEIARLCKIFFFLCVLN
ncbi:MAG: hypothetical protein K2X39_10260 [Silvanigrellaceae bacterium]|nr:hypothetical protein [Silvanigrellaceae bacterium]